MVQARGPRALGAQALTRATVKVQAVQLPVGDACSFAAPIAVFQHRPWFKAPARLPTLPRRQLLPRVLGTESTPCSAPQPCIRHRRQTDRGSATLSAPRHTPAMRTRTSCLKLLRSSRASCTKPGPGDQMHASRRGCMRSSRAQALHSDQATAVTLFTCRRSAHAGMQHSCKAMRWSRALCSGP